jgi:hypothetical protein
MVHDKRISDADKKVDAIEICHVYYMNQRGGGKCSLCGSEGTNKTTCPLNPQATNKNQLPHSLAKTPQVKIPQVPKIQQAPKVPQVPKIPQVKIPQVPKIPF